MLKLPLTYHGFDGKEKTRDFYFNLTQGELAEIHLSLPGGLEGFAKHIDEDQDVEPEDVIRVFKELIIKSYGKRTADGRFIKDPRFTQEFAASDAYSVLFLKFVNNENNFSEKFIEGVLEMSLVDAKKLFENPEPALPEKVETVDDEIL